jgi:uncharacterized protein (TIGR03067 family)
VPALKGLQKEIVFIMKLLLIVALLTIATDKEKDQAKKDLDSLQGTWVMAGLEVEGKQVPEEKITGTTLTIKGDRYIVKVKDTAHEVTIKLDPAKKPKAIDMYFPDGPELPKLAKGIYEVDGDTFKICRAQAPGQDRPREFVTETNTGRFIVTWKRQK